MILLPRCQLLALILESLQLVENKFGNFVTNSDQTVLLTHEGVSCITKLQVVIQISVLDRRVCIKAIFPIIIDVDWTMRSLSTDTLWQFEVTELFTEIEVISPDDDLAELCGERRVNTSILEGVLEHPEELLEVLACRHTTILCLSLLLQTTQFLQLFALHLESLLEPVIVLDAHALSEVVVGDARISNLDGL